MLKILIVDDEMLVRVGMRSLIQWEEHGFRVIGDASDGEAALALMESEVPDIVLTDIVMPGMDGLRLIEEAGKKYPGVRFIALSSYSDFDYVREAMKLGADDYVLKTSVRPEQFLNILNETRRKAEQERKKWKQTAESPTVSERKQQLFMRLLVEPSPDESTFQRYREELDWPESSDTAVFAVHLHHFYRLGPDAKSVSRSLLHLLEQQTREATGKQVFPYKDNEMIMVLFFAEPPDERQLLDIGGDVIRAAKRLINVCVSVGISEPFRRFGHFPAAVRQAKDAVKDSFYGGLGKCYRFDASPREMPESPPGSGEDELLQRLEICDKEGVHRALERLFAVLADRRDPPERRQEFFLDLAQQFKMSVRKWDIPWPSLFDDERSVYTQILELETIDETRRWFEMLADKAIGAMTRVRSQTYRKEISRLIDYLKLHFAENITLSSAARYINMSESYLSTMFKKETGVSFVEYLTRLRIEKAAELLKTSDMPSYIIAEKVGYENINYFGRSFKKVMGVSPSQFRGRFHIRPKEH